MNSLNSSDIISYPNKLVITFNLTKSLFEISQLRREIHLQEVMNGDLGKVHF
jgi:hypothetical protein